MSNAAATDVTKAILNHKGDDASQPDTSELSLEQLREMADKEMNGQPVKQEAKVTDKADKAVKHDLAGRPVKTAEAAEGEVDEDEEDDQPAKKFTVSIDLGDGAGVQKFEGATVEDVNAQLVRAQEHATRKIRELSAKLRKIEEDKKAEKNDEEYVIGKQLQEKPKETVSKLVADALAAEKKRQDEAAQAAQESEKAKAEASQNFLATHPEYIANQANGNKLFRMVNLLDGEARAKGVTKDWSALLEEAFSDLSRDGLLNLKTTEVDDAQKTDDAEPSRIVKTEETAPTQRRRASGLTNRVRVTTPVKSSEPSEEELRTMPLDKLRELADKQLRQGT